MQNQNFNSCLRKDIKSLPSILFSTPHLLESISSQEDIACIRGWWLPDSFDNRAGANTLFLSYVRAGPSVAPLENWTPVRSTLPACLFFLSSDFQIRVINCHRYANAFIFFSICFPLFLCLARSFSLSHPIPRQRLGWTRYLARGFPSRHVFRSEFRTYIFFPTGSCVTCAVFGITFVGLCCRDTP